MKSSRLNFLSCVFVCVFALVAPVLAQNLNAESASLKAFFICAGEPTKRVCKYGFKNDKGEEIIAPRFEHARDFSDGLAVIVANNLFGYVDADGRIAISPRFQRAEDFSEGLAAVQVNGRWGFIDKSGEIVISPEYDGVGRFSEGLAMVHNQNERPPSGYIDKTGKLILKNKEAEFDFSEGLVPIAKRRFGFSWWMKYGFMDRTGKFVIKPRFDDARSFVDGRARVAKGCGPSKLNELSACQWFYIDRSGKVLKNPEVGANAGSK